MLHKKREIEPLALRATVFHPCWDSGSRSADLATRKPVAEGMVREVPERGGRAGEDSRSFWGVLVRSAVHKSGLGPTQLMLLPFQPAVF